MASPPAEMVAMAAFADAQVTDAVRLRVLPSEYVPVAVNCCVLPLAIDGFAGVTAIELNTVALTVRFALPATRPEVAMTCVVPCATPVARPPAVMVAVAELDVDHVDEFVTFVRVPSENVPVAVYCCDLPCAIVALAGVTAIDTRDAGPTVAVVLPLMAPEVALTCDVPNATAVASPVAVTVTVAVLDEDQVTEPVTT